MAIPAFIGEKGFTNLLFGIIMILVSFIASFVLTLLLGFEDAAPENSVRTEEKKPEVSEKKLVQKIEVAAPITGTVKSLADVPDKTFADKLLGDGAAIFPKEGKVTSPITGTVVSIMDTKHGIMLKSEDGLEILIHIGLETVNLNGKYFTAYAKNGDQVKKGDLLLEFDLDAIRAEGYNLITPIVITNSDDYIKVVCMEENGSEVQAGKKLLTVV